VVAVPNAFFRRTHEARAHEASATGLELLPATSLEQTQRERRAARAAHALASHEDHEDETP
jgi:hypothetical protein